MKSLNILTIILVIGIISCKPTNPDVNVDVSSDINDTIDKAPEEDHVNKFLIRDSQAGPFAIGNELPGPATMMTYKMRKEQMTRNVEDGPVTEEVTIIGEGNEDLLWLKPKYTSATEHNNAIAEIIIQSPAYKTGKNIGIGSTISEFVAAYPDAKIWWTYVSDIYVMETSAVKAQFLLDKNDFKGTKPEVKSEMTPLNIADFNRDGKIQKIRMI